MKLNTILIKIKEKIHGRIVKRFRNTPFYYWMYPSFIHSKIFVKNTTTDNENSYLTARPNPGAGIGHQMANWHAGYWFASKFELKFAHIPFSNSIVQFSKSVWESVLGFGDDEIKVENLLNNDFKLVRLPLFDEQNPNEVLTINKIINSYYGRKIVFLCEQDQFYKDQYGVMLDIRNKFYTAKARNDDTLIYDKDNFNVAIHVRRGDIVQKEGENNQNLSKRWLDNDYFVNALKSTLEIIKTNKPIHIYLFSQGKPEDYPEFNNFEHIHFCLDMSAKKSFLHMCYADALITSKSSFSYKPALLNKGLKICPSEFWHGYPSSEDWVLLDNSGNIL